MRNGNSKDNQHNVNKGIQSKAANKHFSILNLKRGDIVTIITGAGETYFASTNAKVGGVQVASGDRVGTNVNGTEVGATTICTMTADGNLDLKLGSWAVIMNITIKTKSDTYQVSSTSTTTDGTVVDDVYDITMTYHGDWTYDAGTSPSRGGSLVSGTYPTGSTNNIPDDGMYLIFTPHVTGQLQANVNIYGNHGTWYLVDKDNGHIFSTKSSKSNDYSNLKDFGTIVEGHTYYLYGLSCDWGYQFHSFKFTPKDNDITSYVVNTEEIVNVGSEIDYVPGITMTYGGAAESTWSKNVAYSHNYAENNGNNASLTDGIPTSGTFVKFTPSVNGILRVGSIGYPQAKTCYVKLTDGVKTETITHDKSNESNGYKDDTFETILASGTTYYVYFSGGSSGYYSKFCDFSFEKIPSTVSTTIGDKGYTTFSSSYPLNLDGVSGGTAYSVVAAGVEESEVTPSAASGSVAAGEGLILAGEPGASVTIPVATSGDAISGNLMVGCPNGTTIDSETTNYANFYVLVNGTTEAEFQNLKNWIVGGQTVTIPAGKAYLDATGTAGANSGRSLRISFGGITGVKNVEAATAEAAQKDGKFIENGKLVIVKNGKKFNANGTEIK